MGYGTWVSGGSWSTAEGRAILAHFRGGWLDLAAASMGRLIDPCVAAVAVAPRLPAFLPLPACLPAVLFCGCVSISA